MRYLTIILFFISSLAMAQRPYLFPTISDAASNTYIGIGAYVQTQGYHASGDGGGALYRMTAVASAPMVADSGYVYPVTATKVLVQVLEGEYLESATYGVKCGDSGAAAANYSRLQRYFNAIDTLDKQAHINGCNDTIYVAFSSALTVNLASHDKFVMRGDGADVTRIKSSSGTLAFTFSDNAKVNLFDIYLHGYDATAFGGIGGMDQALTLDSTETSYTITTSGGSSVVMDKNDYEVVPVFFFIGESNSGGQTLNTSLTAAELDINRSVLIYNSVFNEFQPLDIGTNNQDRHYFANVVDTLNPATYHGWENGIQNDLDNYGITKAYIVKAGQGGSRISMWDEVDTFQILAVQKIDNVTEILRQNRQRPKWYIFFSFGINDALASTDTTTFKAGVISWINRIQGHMGQTAPVLSTELNSCSASYAAYTRQIQSLADSLGWWYMIETDDLTCASNHWNAAGMDSIARRAGRIIRDSIGLAGLYAGANAASSSNSASFSLITSTSTATDTIDWLNRDNSVAQINMASTTETVLTLLNPRTDGVPFYKIHFQGVTALADSVVFPNNVISYAGDSLKARILPDDVLVELYYDGATYWANDTIGSQYTPGGGGGGTSYLLDDYPGAAAAYSLEQISSSATNVVRVRRSSDNAEIDLTATQVTDGTLTTWTGANDAFVVTWYDQSGNTGRDVTQSNTAYQPKLVNSGSLILENGKPSIEFSGTNYLEEADTSSWLQNRADIFHFQVVSTAANYVPFVNQNTAAATYFIIAQSGSSSTTLSGVNVTRTAYYINSSLGASTTRGQIFTELCTGTQKLLTIDGATSSNLENQRQHTVGMYALNLNNSFGFNLNGKIQEYIIYTSDQSANRANIEADINTRYSIY